MVTLLLLEKSSGSLQPATGECVGLQYTSNFTIACDLHCSKMIQNEEVFSEMDSSMFLREQIPSKCQEDRNYGITFRYSRNPLSVQPVGLALKL